MPIRPSRPCAPVNINFALTILHNLWLAQQTLTTHDIHTVCVFFVGVSPRLLLSQLRFSSLSWARQSAHSNCVCVFSGNFFRRRARLPSNNAVVLIATLMVVVVVAALCVFCGAAGACGKTRARRAWGSNGDCAAVLELGTAEPLWPYCPPT